MEAYLEDKPPADLLYAGAVADGVDVAGVDSTDNSGDATDDSGTAKDEVAEIIDDVGVVAGVSLIAA